MVRNESQIARSPRGAFQPPLGIVIPGSSFPDSGKGRFPGSGDTSLNALFHGLPKTYADWQKNNFVPRIGVAYAGVLIAKPEAPDPVLRWVVLMGTLTVAAVVIGLLRFRIERLVRRLRRRMGKQELVAELGRRAVAGAEVTELIQMTLSAVAESLEVEHAGLLQAIPGEDELLLAAGNGWRGARPGETAVNRDDPVIQRVLASETAVTDSTVQSSGTRSLPR